MNMTQNTQALNSTTAKKQIYPPKILQFGGGNFLRGFVDWMVDELNSQTDFDGSVIVVKPTERGDYTALRNQDGLFHVLTKGIKNGELIDQQQLIHCVDQVIHPYLAWGDYLKTAEIPSLRFIISNTTESGIQANEADLMEQHPPKEFPAKLTHWLYRRYQHFNGSSESGCIIIPCELIENNGVKLKNCILQYATWWNLPSEFSAWIESHNIFCNTLVDRIVPGFPTSDREQIEQSLGFKDDLLVAAEPYHIWAIQSDKPIHEELPFDQTDLNVKFTDDLAPFRQLKVSILNGAHTTMVPLGYLNGIDTVREAIEDEVVGTFMQQLITKEILPTLDFPSETLDQYASDVIDRFKNPFIHHQLISISLNSTSKFKTRVLPTLLKYVEKKGQLPQRIVFSFACLFWFYRGKRGDAVIPLKDDPQRLRFFADSWKQHEADQCSIQELVSQVLARSDFWGQDLNEIVGLKELLVTYLLDIEGQGVAAVLAAS